MTTNGHRPSARDRYSPTRQDSVKYRVGKSGRLILGGGYGLGFPQALPKYLPTGVRSRDKILYRTPRAESQWGSALSIAITKLSAWSWDVENLSPARRATLQQLLLTADFGHPSGLWGWIPFMERLGRDFLTTNNGCHFVVNRISRAYGSKIVGLRHLSSLRCYRTGDPDYPIIYTDRLGKEITLRWFDVVSMVDCPEPDDVGYGIGFCAAERAYDQIKKLSALENFVYEKLTANSPTAFYLINGINQQQLDDILADARNDQDADGLQQYMGAIIATMLRPDQTPAFISIPLAGLPDNANPDTERARSDLVYANSLGMDPNEIRPQGGTAMGIGAASQIQHEKGKGKGIISFRGQVHHRMNWDVFDTRSRFYFTDFDIVDEERRARTCAAYGTAMERYIRNGTLSPRQGQEWLIQRGILPRRFAGRNLVGDSLSDMDKPKLQEIQDRESSSAPQPIDEFVDPRRTKPGQTKEGAAPSAPSETALPAYALWGSGRTSSDLPPPESAVEASWVGGQ